MSKTPSITQLNKKKIEAYTSYNNVVNYKDIVRNVIRNSEKRLFKKKNHDLQKQVGVEEDITINDKEVLINEDKTYRESQYRDPEDMYQQNIIKIKDADKSFENQSKDEMTQTKNHEYSLSEVLYSKEQEQMVIKAFNSNDSQYMSKIEKEIILEHTTPTHKKMV